MKCSDNGRTTRWVSRITALTTHVSSVGQVETSRQHEYNPRHLKEENGSKSQAHAAHDTLGYFQHNIDRICDWVALQHEHSIHYVGSRKMGEQWHAFWLPRTRDIQYEIPSTPIASCSLEGRRDSMVKDRLNVALNLPSSRSAASKKTHYHPTLVLPRRP
ncbi:hypothetical protein PM082_019673 [Marasmius tenuissimus]|nr:hypothetical protein PM082_019673 [Marasmius tenuissimus]